MKLIEGIAFLAIIFLFTTLNWGALTSYFSQDDFFHLTQVFDKSIFDIPKFFLPSNDLGYAFYRPVSRELYSFIMFNLFNLSSVPYHLVNISLIFINSFLLYKIALIFAKKELNSVVVKNVAIFSVVFYLLSAVHNVELYYLSSVQTLLATVFALCCILNFKKYLDLGKRKSLILAIIFFTLALGSHESAIVIILILGVLQLSKNWQVNKEVLKSLVANIWPFLLLVFLRFMIFLQITGLPQQSVYQPVFSIKSLLNSLSWFTLWSFGAPEILVDFIGSGFHLNPNFLKWYGDYAIVVFPSLGFLIGSLILLLIFKKELIKDKHSFSTNRNLILFLICFTVSLTPFLFFPWHKFIYYLSFPIVWLSLFLGEIMSQLWRTKFLLRVFVVLYLVAFLVVTYETVNLNKITYWAAKRATAAQYLLSDIKLKYPSVDKNTVFYIIDDPNYPNIAKEWGTSSRQASYILSGSDAFRLLYQDSKIRVYYQYMNNLPENIDESKIIKYMAKFPY